MTTPSPTPQPTPAAQLLAAIEVLEQESDPVEAALRAHELQDTMKAITPRLRKVLEQTVAEWYESSSSSSTRVSQKEIADRLGVTVQRVNQMIGGKHGRQRRTDPPLVYAARVAEDGEPWYGEPEALAAGEFETGFIEFQPADTNRFAGHWLEVRYGPVPDDGLQPELQSFTTIKGRRLRLTKALQDLLFAPDSGS